MNYTGYLVKRKDPILAVFLAAALGPIGTFYVGVWHGLFSFIAILALMMLVDRYELSYFMSVCYVLNIAFVYGSVILYNIKLKKSVDITC